VTLLEKPALRSKGSPKKKSLSPDIMVDQKIHARDVILSFHTLSFALKAS